MKQFLFALIIIVFILSGCSQQKEIEIESPAEIYTESGIISYNDTESAVEKNSVFENIIFDENGNIRVINLTDSKYTTFHNISVGDSVSKVIDEFTYEYKATNNVYCVLFSEKEEIAPTSEDKEDNYIWISYTFDNKNIITEISIYDVKYGREMK